MHLRFVQFKWEKSHDFVNCLGFVVDLPNKYYLWIRSIRSILDKEKAKKMLWCSYLIYRFDFAIWTFNSCVFKSSICRWSTQLSCYSLFINTKPPGNEFLNGRNFVLKIPYLFFDVIFKSLAIKFIFEFCTLLETIK